MKKELIGVFLCMMLVGAVLPVAGNIIVNKNPYPSILGNTHYVGGDGPGNYTSIQDAINDTVDGDTVYVYNHSSPYYESLVINKSINLIGENKLDTIIDGNFIGNVIKIINNNVMVSGFTIRNSYYDCVKIQSSSNSYIYDNIIYQDSISNGQDGIVITGLSSTFNNISKNEVFGCDGAVELSANDNIIYENIFYQNEWGIIIFGDNNNKIISNFITENNWGGITMYSGSNNQISCNIITKNGLEYDGFGGINAVVDTFREGDNYIFDNIITNNSRYGISVGQRLRYPYEYESGPRIKFYVTDNDISKNKFYGIIDSPAGSSIIARNNLIDNPTNAYFESYNLFRKNTIWIKNYWSDYTGSSFYKIDGKLFIFLPWFKFDWHPASEPYDFSEPEYPSVVVNVENSKIKITLTKGGNNYPTNGYSFANSVTIRLNGTALDEINLLGNTGWERGESIFIGGSTPALDDEASNVNQLSSGLYFITVIIKEIVIFDDLITIV